LFLGIISLFTKIFTGIVKTLDTILFAITKTLTKITCDSEYVKLRQANRNRIVRTFRESFYYGTKNLKITLIDGLTGLCTKPCKIRNKYNKRTFGTIAKGTWQGLAGTIIKPVVGIFDFVHIMLRVNSLFLS